MARQDGSLEQPSEQPEQEAENMVLVDETTEDTVREEQIADHSASRFLRRRRILLIASTLALVAAGCAALASIAADSAVVAEGGEGETADAQGTAVEALSGGAEGSVAAVRRLEENGQEANVGIECTVPVAGSSCDKSIRWTMEHGIVEHPEWYPNLSPTSSFEQFQLALHADPHALCPRPCGVDALQPQTNVTVPVVGWDTSGRVVSQGQWCATNEPQSGWSLENTNSSQGVEVKILTYNLFWWNLFGRRKGDGGSAGRLIAGAGNPRRFDVMGFQECEGIAEVLEDAGLADDYGALVGPHAMCMAFDKAAWDLLDDGAHDVAEDRGDQWYGTRAGMWARMQHKQTGRTLFFINHHGPLPVNSGGRCGGEATAYNLLKLIATKAKQDDAIVLVGDFNSGPDSTTVQKLRQRLHSIYTGTSFGGVDNILSSSPHVINTRNLGSGGSDHDALEATIST
mmetsp:Transcript_112740/g.291357  ORF Transcript_112740/g.291357 Transcript_112740/m.291357 type:complete len:457 (-) Transcript_112740:586-1956(-)